LLLLAAKKLREKAWLNWIICVPLAAIFLSHTFKSLLDVIATTAPRRFTALTTSCSAAHIYLLSV
jgi:hypothetical protein